MAELLLYPSSRPDRGDPVQSFAAGGGDVSLPRARIWPWFVGSSGAARTTVVSGPFQTPCLIYQIVSQWVQAGSGAGNIAILYSTDDSGTQGAGAVAKPSGTPIMDPLSFRSNVVTTADEIPEGWTVVGEGGTVAVPFNLECKYLINVAGPVFLKATLRTSAGEVRTRGFCLVFEGSSVEQLQNFL